MHDAVSPQLVGQSLLGAHTLGAMIAAQLFQAALKESPNIPEAIAQGDFAPLVAWLRAHIHQQGWLLSPQGLLAAAIGNELDTSCYIEHLERRYLRGA